MAVKLIVCDLDGTLMSTDHTTVTPRTIRALRSAHERGIKTAIATGRCLALTDGVTQQLEFIDYVITGNGAAAYDRAAKKNICTDSIQNETAKKVIEYFLDKEVFFEVYVNGRSQYQLGTEKYFCNEGFPEGFIDEVQSVMDGHGDLLEYLGDRDIEKITLYSVKDSDYCAYKSKMLEYGLNAVTSFPGNLEATAQGASKGTALKMLCEKLKIDRSQVMSFGDAENDCSMLEYAGLSFAMENGSDACKASAKYITESNADDGVARAVEKYALV